MTPQSSQQPAPTVIAVWDPGAGRSAAGLPAAEALARPHRSLQSEYPGNDGEQVPNDSVKPRQVQGRSDSDDQSGRRIHVDSRMVAHRCPGRDCRLDRREPRYRERHQAEAALQQSQRNLGAGRQQTTHLGGWEWECAAVDDLLVRTNFIVSLACRPTSR